jgi:hypothetical protein
VRNVRGEPADRTLDGIAAGLIALCVLVWVPTMVGGDQAEVLQRWQELARRRDIPPHLRADYVALALVFAELVGRETVWSAALKEFDVKDSRIAQQWEDKAVAAALRGSVARVLRKRFPGTAVPEEVAPILEKLTDREELSRWVDEASVTPSPEQFHQQLARALSPNGTPTAGG